MCNRRGGGGGGRGEVTGTKRRVTRCVTGGGRAGGGGGVGGGRGRGREVTGTQTHGILRESMTLFDMDSFLDASGLLWEGRSPPPKRRVRRCVTGAGGVTRRPNTTSRYQVGEIIVRNVSNETLATAQAANSEIKTGKFVVISLQ